jgi:hypothetical protein
MKIISGFKDYYDFVQGQFGIDALITYERHFNAFNRNGSISKNKWEKISINEQPKLKHLENFIFAICGDLYFVANLNDTLYFGPEALVELLKIKEIQKPLHRMFDPEIRHFERMSKIHLTHTDINDKENCPILILNKNGNGGYKNPRLSDFGFPKIIDPQTLFISISQFLTREPIILDKRTDIQHLEAAGFDKKVSFRKM